MKRIPQSKEPELQAELEAEQIESKGLSHNVDAQIRTAEPECEPTETERTFLLEVFKQINDHIRATDTKTTTVTGTYLTIYAVLFSSITPLKWQDPSTISVNAQVAIEVFFLVVSAGIFLKQHWYRAWKVHYLDVVIAIRKALMPKVDRPELLPYWLRDNDYRERFSLSNTLKYLVVLSSYTLILFISLDLRRLIAFTDFAVPIGIVATILYTVFLRSANQLLFRGKPLNA